MISIQTLKNFLDNPMGKGSNAIPSRMLIRNDLTTRFNRMLKEMKKEVKVTAYKDGNEYYLHLLIPSESVKRKNTYDVVLHFTLMDENKDAKDDKNLNRYLVKFFSNNPSFTYTYAYAFSLHGMLVEQLEDKYKSDVLHNLPVTRNPAEIINYEKSITFAALYLLEHHSEYLNKITLDPIAKPFKASELEKHVRNTDKIEVELKAEISRVRQEEAEEAKKEKASLAKVGRRSERNIPENKKTVPSSPKKVAPMAKKEAKGSSKGKIRPR